MNGGKEFFSWKDSHKKRYRSRKGLANISQTASTLVGLKGSSPGRKKKEKDAGKVNRRMCMKGLELPAKFWESIGRV